MSPKLSARIPALDGVRALAAIAVLGLHCHVFADSWAREAMGIFFSLSGFLICGLFLDSSDTATLYRRRAARILPLFLLVATVDAVAAEGPYRWMLFLAPNVRPLLVRDYVSREILWSLGTEIQGVYLFLPWLIRSTPRARLGRMLVTFAVLAVVARWAVELREWNPMAWYMLTPFRLDAICFGALAAWMLRERVELTRYCPVIAVFAWGVVLGQSEGEGWQQAGLFAAAVRQTAASVGTAAMIVCFAEGRAAGLARILDWRPLAWLGSISYGLYLLHPLAMTALHSTELAGWVFFTKTLTLTVALSVLSRRLLEEPIIRWTQRRTSKPPLPAPAASATTPAAVRPDAA